MRARLKSGFWVQGFIRQCDVGLLPAVILRRGDADAGAVILKLNRLNGTAEVLSQFYGPDGAVWLRVTGPEPVPEADADARIRKESQRDPDLWVVEVELRDGLPLLADPVEDVKSR